MTRSAVSTVAAAALAFVLLVALYYEVCVFVVTVAGAGKAYRAEKSIAELSAKVDKLAQAIGYDETKEPRSSSPSIDKSLQEIEDDVRRIDAIQRQMIERLGWDRQEYWK